MKRKLITMILMSAITCCLFAGCGSASQAQPDKTDEVKEASLKSENKSEEKTEEKSEDKMISRSRYLIYNPL